MDAIGAVAKADIDADDAALHELSVRLEALAKYCATRELALAYRGRGAVNDAALADAKADRMFRALPDGWRW
jgi:hypothetical protein